MARVAAIELQHPATSDEIGKGYKIVNDDLWTAQHYKCCYCESKEQSKNNDVEHYRPKARAIRTPGSAAVHGYWWLAWTWENLLFSCRNCNRPPAKVDKFPLAQGSIPLVAQQPPPGKEMPLLIDPASENGCDFIMFIPETPANAASCRWRPVARNGDPRGAMTIQVCMLDRPDLLDLYADHIQHFVMIFVEEIRQAMNGNSARLGEAWQRAIIALLNPHQRYVGLSRDALDFFIPKQERLKWGLKLPSCITLPRASP